MELNWKLTNIDPMYILEVYQYKDMNREGVVLHFFDKYGCVKAYSELIDLCKMVQRS